MKRFILKNLADTDKLARNVAKTLRGGGVIALSGPLGSGKTTFVQFLAKALGVKRTVKSPTFVLLQTYKISEEHRTRNTERGTQKAKLLCHVDCYRLNNANELYALGLHDYLGKTNVITII